MGSCPRLCQSGTPIVYGGRNLFDFISVGVLTQLLGNARALVSKRPLNTNGVLKMEADEPPTNTETPLRHCSGRSSPRRGSWEQPREEETVRDYYLS